MAINTVTLIGYLGGDPQTRSLPSGDTVANFSLATTDHFRGRNGTRQQRTDWHRIVAFGKLAETCARYLSSGRQVYVEGRLTTREYQAKDGSDNHNRTEIVARQVRFLGRRSNASERPRASEESVPF